MQQIISVVICGNLHTTFDYLNPFNCNNLIGKRVLVPFGKKELIGFVIAIKQQSSISISKLKQIVRILDEIALIQEPTINLINFASVYYFIPLGLIYKMALPKVFRTNIELPSTKTPSAAKITLTQTENIFTLNNEQQTIIDSIIANHGFRVEVIDGVTGSGKTAVYLELIEFYLQQQKQILILIPEINLTPQTYSRFKNKFNDKKISLIHSKITDKQRYIAWHAALNGNVDIIIGTRSAAFTPLQNPGLFIIDEEHDASFKQQTNPRYSARDLLIKRAHLENVPIVIGSASLSAETMLNVQQHKYNYHVLHKRAGKAIMPTIEIIDIHNKDLFAGLSQQSIHAIQNSLDEQSQVMLFINRRGFAPILYCCNCNWKKLCKYCASTMTIHMQDKQLICHHCTTKEKFIYICPECNHNDLQPVGIGTERLELALREKFNSYNILRIDKDTSNTVNKLTNNLNTIHNAEADIIIATQMLAKGHHFHNLNLIIILNIDQAFYSTDFRSIEKTAQLLLQLSGRAGRVEKQGKVLIQTNWHEHYLFAQIVHGSYKKLLELILIDRKNFRLPPYEYQILIIAHHKKATKAIEWLELIKYNINKYAAQIDCMGPIPAVIERKKNIYTFYLTLQSTERKKLHIILKEVLLLENIIALGKNLKWEIDVDPASII